MTINNKLIILILLSATILCTVGILSGYSLGDEVQHFRMAREIFTLNKQPVFDSAYGQGTAPGYFYNWEPFWHIGLAIIWKIFTKPYFPIAQIYHTLYFILLLIITYRLAKKLYSRENGFNSVLILASVPVIISFSILFYLDIPATMFSTLCVLLIIKRRFIWAGVVLALMYFIKRSLYFFIPAFIFITLYKSGSLKEKFKNLFLLFVFPLLGGLLDIIWRSKIFKSSAGIATLSGTINFLKEKYIRICSSDKIVEYLNSYILNPIDIVKYFGVVLLILIILYFLYKKYEKNDILLWIPIINYMFFYFLMFGFNSDIRYLMPIIPYLAIIASKSLDLFKNKKTLKIFLIIICFVQFISVCFYTYKRRHLGKEIKEAFIYIKENTPEDSLILYPEYNLLEFANRKIIWKYWQSYNWPTILFWSDDPVMVKKAFDINKIDYVAVKKLRIYDDSTIRHIGGYPKSFVDRLPRLDFLKLVFENKEISLWKVVR